MRGDLSETTAAGACRSLATREASGALLIDASEGTGLIRLRQGRIVGVASPTPGARVGDRLVGAGMLERAALDEVLDEQRGGVHTRPLHRALVDRGLVPEEAAHRVLLDRMLDALLEVTQLRTGTFLFLTEEELHAEGSPGDDVHITDNGSDRSIDDGSDRSIDDGSDQLALDVEDAFRTVAQREEELREVRARIPHASVVPAPASAAVDAHGDEVPDADAATILAQIDGHRSIEEVAGTVGYGVLEVTRIVDGLVTAGLVDLERPTDAVGAELDNAIRQLSGHAALSDASPSYTSPPDTSTSDVSPSATGAEDDQDHLAAETDDVGPLIEAELPHRPDGPGEPATAGRGTPTGPEVAATGEAHAARGTPDAHEAREARDSREARETGVSWDDLFGGGDSAPSAGGATAPPPTTTPAAHSDDDADADRRSTPVTREGAATGSPIDPPPFFADTRGPDAHRPDAADSHPADHRATPDARADRRSTDQDTDVSEFLRELSRLALGEDAPLAPRRSGVEPPPPAEAPRPTTREREDDERARRSPSPADSDHARRRRGFFGRG